MLPSAFPRFRFAMFSYPVAHLFHFTIQLFGCPLQWDARCVKLLSLGDFLSVAALCIEAGSPNATAGTVIVLAGPRPSPLRVIGPSVFGRMCRTIIPAIRYPGAARGIHELLVLQAQDLPADDAGGAGD